MKSEVGPLHTCEPERDRLGVVEAHAIGDDSSEPVGSPRRGVNPNVVPLRECVVPKDVRAHARVEAEVEKPDWREPGAVIGPEREEIVDRFGEVRTFRPHDERAERSTKEKLAYEVDGREDDARYPESHVSGGRLFASATIVIGYGTLRRRVRSCDERGVAGGDGQSDREKRDPGSRRGAHWSLAGLGPHRQAERQRLTCMFIGPSMGSVPMGKPNARGSLACFIFRERSGRRRSWGAYPTRTYPDQSAHVARRMSRVWP